MFGYKVMEFSLRKMATICHVQICHSFETNVPRFQALCAGFTSPNFCYAHNEKSLTLKKEPRKNQF